MKTTNTPPRKRHLAPCPDCDGAGEGYCSHCNGIGTRYPELERGPICGRCKGAGSRECPTCEGAGEVLEDCDDENDGEECDGET